MFCKYCGAKIEENSKLCQKCQKKNQHEDKIEKTNSSNHLGRAGFWIRYVAHLIDAVVIGLISIIVAVIVSLIFHQNIDISGQIVIFPLFLIYYIFMTYKYQCTLGKRMLGIRVISQKNNKLTMGQVILRETLGKALALLIAMTGVGFLIMLMTDWVHDIIAKTSVVYKGY